eukprot:FN601536.1.p1 GENE.FN601536.1~~FN601536.1.p1  ORF type:complete len:64 (+),score=2.18 FN601536.1:3-194(+)
MNSLNSILSGLFGIPSSGVRRMVEVPGVKKMVEVPQNKSVGQKTARLMHYNNITITQGQVPEL